MTAMNIERAPIVPVIHRAASIVVMASLTVIGIVLGRSVADGNIASGWSLGGIAACAITALLWHRWKTWWGIPRIVRLLGHTEAFDEAYAAILASGERAAPLFRQGLSFEREVPTGARNDVRWSPTVAHRLAVEGLGHVKDPQAVEVLQRILRNRLIRDDVLRAKAVWALGEIGASASVRQLVPLLGNLQAVHDERHNDVTVSVRYTTALKRSAAIVEGKTIGSLAGDALVTLGQGELVQAFQEALEGRWLKLNTFLEEWRAPLNLSLIQAARTGDQVTATNAVVALAELGLLEAQSELRMWSGPLGRKPAWMRQTCLEAVRKLERFQSLPVPAAGRPVGHQDLPRPAATELGTENLPRRHTD